MTIAALFVPLAWMLAWLVATVSELWPGNCRVEQVRFNYEATRCAVNSYEVFWTAGPAFMLLLLWVVLWSVRTPHAFGKTFLVALALGAGVVVEAIIGFQVTGFLFNNPSYGSGLSSVLWLYLAVATAAAVVAGLLARLHFRKRRAEYFAAGGVSGPDAASGMGATSAPGGAYGTTSPTATDNTDVSGYPPPPPPPNTRTQQPPPPPPPAPPGPPPGTTFLPE